MAEYLMRRTTLGDTPGLAIVMRGALMMVNTGKSNDFTIVTGVHTMIVSHVSGHC